MEELEQWPGQPDIRAQDVIVAAGEAGHRATCAGDVHGVVVPLQK